MSMPTKPMSVIAWGTRGSIAISNRESVQAGGNTTCYEVRSSCLPPNTKLMLDAGTGFVPAGWKYLSEIGNGLNYMILFSHWHYDHILGLTMAPPTFIDSVPMTLIGPVDGDGPREMVNHIFKRPYFPVDASRINHKMSYHPLKDFDVSIIVVHPQGGFYILKRDRYIRSIKSGDQISFGRKRGSYPLNECMVIKMSPANHGNAVCISYRFEEMPTGKTFVLLTDHEDEAGFATDFRNHLEGADLVVMDAQYNSDRYLRQTARYGHGTPRGAIRQGVVCGVKRIALTHHDPQSTDAFLNGVIIEEAREELGRLRATQEFLETHGMTKDVILTDQEVSIAFDYEELKV